MQAIQIAMPNKNLTIEDCLRTGNLNGTIMHYSWEISDNKVLVFQKMLGTPGKSGLFFYESRAAYFNSIKSSEWISVAEPFVHEAPSPTMYNSHGEWSTLGEIYDIEVGERGNCTFDDVDIPWIEKHRNCPAIWGTVKPVDALRYAIAADEWEDADEVLEARYPDYKEEMICEIDTVGLVRIGSDDGDGGYLLVDIEG